MSTYITLLSVRMAGLTRYGGDVDLIVMMVHVSVAGDRAIFCSHLRHVPAGAMVTRSWFCNCLRWTHTENI